MRSLSKTVALETLLVLVLRLISGFCDVPHTMPLAVMVAPPLELMFTTLVALVAVMFAADRVLSVGTLAVVVKDTWLP